MQQFIPGIIMKYLDGHKAPAFVTSLVDFPESPGANVFPRLREGGTLERFIQDAQRRHLLLKEDQRSTLKKKKKAFQTQLQTQP